MAGKRLLDLAVLFNASYNVAQKHATLRSQQLELWYKTSRIVQRTKGQAGRIAENAKGYPSLNSRFNKDATTITAVRDLPLRQRDGLEQDHLYEVSECHVANNLIPTRNLHMFQKTSNRNAIPDGLVPPQQLSLNVSKRDYIPLMGPAPKTHKDAVNKQQPSLERSGNSKYDPGLTSLPLSSLQAMEHQHQHEQQVPSQPADAEAIHSRDESAQGSDEGVSFAPSKHFSPLLSSLLRIKFPKRAEHIQYNDYHLQHEGMDSEFYSSVSPGGVAIPSAQALPKQKQIPEGISADLFNTPRVAMMLGGGTHYQCVEDLGVESPGGLLQKEKEGDSAINSDSFLTTGPVSNDLFRTHDDNEKPAESAKHNKKDINSLQDSAGRFSPSSPAPYEMRESKVPSTRLGRLWNYGGLAAGMFGGALTESIRQATGSGGDGSYILSARNMDRLVVKLSRMRGAALKLGQMMSFQDSKMLPTSIQQVLLRVQDSADYMPSFQRDEVLSTNLGSNWRDLFSAFEEKPMAAASIGQVHSATLRSTGQHVAVKVQYPGVADSIDSDLSNLAILLTASRILPRGLYLDKTIANARTELAWECDYIREAECIRRFQELLSDEENTFAVPKIFSEASGKQVLTMEYMNGEGVTKVTNLTQDQRDWIGTQILKLCLREITEFRFMQTDPNWTNFLYNKVTNKLELLDFGASRAYSEEFISLYARLLVAASRSSTDTIRELSIELGYLTGHESRTMLNAHIASVLILAEPFLVSSPQTYDFRDQTITKRVKALIPVMVRERLAPPPEETYSLHRKLSGAFLLCARLGSQVRCRELFETCVIKGDF